MGDRTHPFEELAEHMGAAYLRYSFTKGTVREIDFIVEALDLAPGDRVLDVGCGPGRHALELAARGFDVVGVDVADAFLRVARQSDPGARLVRADAARLPFRGGFDAVVSICQGAFGMGAAPGRPAWPDPDGLILESMADVLRPGGAVFLTAFSAYFALRFLEESDRFDAAAGCNSESTTVRDTDGRSKPAQLVTSCFTPRELRLLCDRAGIGIEAIWSGAPGRYATSPPTIDDPELLVVGRRKTAVAP